MSKERPDYLQTADTTEEVIRSRLLSHVDDKVDKAEGSYVWDAHAPVAIELVFVRMALQRALELGFAQTTDLEHLVMRAAEHGVAQKKATKAIGTVKIIGKAGSIVPKGLQLATEADADLDVKSVFFLTTKEMTIPDSGEVEVPIEAQDAGSSGNVAAGSIVVLAQSRKSISAVTNSSATTGGMDDEDYDSLLYRYLEKVRNPGTSGNIADYKQWATSVDGVGAAHVIPLWEGEGTVKVVIIDNNKKPANAEIVAAVQKYLSVDTGSGDRMAPIGATVTVVPATAKPINVQASLLLDRDSGMSKAEVEKNLKTKLDAYLKKLAFQASTIRYARIGAIILEEEGVVDYNAYTLNGGMENISIADDEVALLGELILNVD